MSEKSRQIPFSKYQGLGNDFIFVLADDVQGVDRSTLAQQVCERHFGIGADGLAVISRENDLRMDFYNADGSEAPMCGNASRCAALFAREKQLIDAPAFTLQTKGGNGRVYYLPDGDYRVELVPARLASAEVPVLSSTDRFFNQTIEAGGRQFELSAVFMMTPHAVIFTDRIVEEDVLEYGPLIENHPLFPHKINVNFVEIKDRGHVRQVTWERGAGRTLACGTGCCATVTVGNLTGRLDPVAEVEMDGGRLTIEYSADYVAMTGQARKIASGVYWLPEAEA